MRPTSLKEKLKRWHSDVDNAFYGWNGAWLDPQVSQLGYFGVSRLHPGAGRDPARRRRSVRDHPSDRDRARRMLLSGRRDDRFRVPDIRRIAKRRRRRSMRFQNLLNAFCICMKARKAEPLETLAVAMPR